MAVTLALAPIPFWYFTDGKGLPCVNGKLYTFDHFNHDLPKPTYSQPINDPQFALPNPIILDGTGTINTPIYWLHGDTTTYYLELYDEDGNLVRAIDNFPIDAGGGSTPVEIDINVQNYAVNGQFRYNYNLPSPSIANVEIPVARGNWFFFKDSASTTNSLGFYPFVLADTSPTANPRNAFLYQDAGTIATEARRDLYIKFPDVKTFNNEQVTVSFQAMSSVPATVEIFTHQDFGTGGSAVQDHVQSSASISVGSFGSVVSTFTVPSVAPYFRGPNGDDYLAIGVRFGLNTNGNFQFTNMQIERGVDASANFIYDGPLNDEYRTVQLPDIYQVGDIKHSYALPANMPGWLLLDDTTLGSTVSAATHAGATYYNLYVFLWNNVSQPSGNVYCKVGTSLGANANADWQANKTLQLPFTKGRVFGNIGLASSSGSNTWVNGQFGGADQFTMATNQVGQHTHNITMGTGGDLGSGVNDLNTVDPTKPSGSIKAVLAHGVNSGDIVPEAITIVTSPAPSPISLVQCSAYINTYIKL